MLKPTDLSTIIKLAADRGRRQGLKGAEINLLSLQKTAEQFGQAAERYIQTYCAAHQEAFDSLSPTERIIRLARTTASKHACKNTPINESFLQTKANKFENLAPLYIENFLTAYQNAIVNRPMNTIEKEKYKENFAVLVLANLKFK